MTKPQVVFHPFSEEYFENPFDIYRRMREDAPLYYDEKEDFYAITRHEDVAAALKDHETYSSSRGCDLSMVRKGISADMRSIIFMDPPDHRHMRSLLNKAFTPRAVQSQTETVHEVIDKYLGAVDPERLRRGAGLLRTVPGRGHHQDGRRARGIPPAGAALDRHQPVP